MTEQLGKALLDLAVDDNQLAKGLDKAETGTKTSAEKMEQSVAGAAGGMEQEVDQAAQGMKQSLGGAAGSAQGDASKIEGAFDKAATGIEQEMSGAGVDAEQSIDGIREAAVQAGAVIGGALAVDAAIGSLDDATKASGRLQARLGLTEEQAESFDKVAKNVYRNNFGESMTEASNAVSLVHQALGLTGGRLQETTEDVMGLSDAFEDQGADVQIITDGVRAMKKAYPGMSEKQILDQITYAFQQGAGTAGDFQDTLQEYPQYFKTIGLNGKDMMNFLTLGMKNGARNTDFLADAVKEFGIRVKTAGDTGQKALSKMFPPDEAARIKQAFAEGGQAGRDAFYKVMEQLAATKDEQEKYTLATELFGTKGEDLVGVLDKMTPAFLKSKDAQDKSKGATEDLDEQYGGIQDSMESLKRKIETSFVGSFGEAAGAVVGFGGQAGMAVMGLSAVTGTNIASMIGNFVKLGAQSLIQAGRVALAWMIAMGPIPLIVLAVAGLAYLIVKHWDEIKEFLEKTWGKIKDTAVKVWGGIKNFLKNNWDKILAIMGGPLGIITLLVIRNWDKIKAFTHRIWTSIRDTIAGIATGIKDRVVGAFTGLKDRTFQILNNVVGFVKDIPGRVMDGIRSLAEKLAEFATRAFGGFKTRAVNIADSVVGFVRKLPGRITNAIGDLSSTLYEEGKALISGLLEGIKDGLKAVWEEVGSIAGKIKDLKGPLPDDFRLLQPEGGAIIDGLWAGMEAQLGTVETNVSGVAPDLASNFRLGMNRLPSPNIPSAIGTAGLGVAGASPSGQGSTLPDIDLTVYLGDREIKDIIGTEIDAHGHEAGQVWIAGAGGIG